MQRAGPQKCVYGGSTNTLPNSLDFFAPIVKLETTFMYICAYKQQKYVPETQKCDTVCYFGHVPDRLKYDTSVCIACTLCPQLPDTLKCDGV